MALCQIPCPHCDKEVELDVTSVTRTRTCPNCGQSILLEQVTKQKRSKGTAPMAPSVDAGEALGQASHTERAGPQPLEGDVFDRMMHDPEVRQNLRRLIWGTGILIGVIILLCVLDRIEWSAQPDSPAPRSASSSPGASDAAATGPASLVGSASQSPRTTGPFLSATPSSLAQPPASLGNPAPPSAPPPPPGVPSAKPPPSDEERAMETVRSFLNAKNVDERLLTVRSVSSMEPVMRAYYDVHPDGPISFIKITPESAAFRSSPIRRFQVELPGGQKRRATVGRSNSKTAVDYRVDWASFVVRSEMDWDEFMQKRPTAPIFMRVFMAPSPSASAEFPDTNYLCVKLTNPLNPASPPIYGYAGRDSALEKTLNLLLRLYTGEPYPVRMTLKHPAQAQSTANSGDQVLIEQFVGEGWLSTAETDFR